LNPVSFTLSTCSTLSTLVSPLIELSSKHQNPQESFHCALGKQHRQPFPQVASYMTESQLDMFHADLCGQIKPNTLGGKNYFLLLVDDYFRFMWIELLATKDEAFKCFKRVKALAETAWWQTSGFSQ
jgi:hypothetical protein